MFICTTLVLRNPHPRSARFRSERDWCRVHAERRADFGRIGLSALYCDIAVEVAQAWIARAADLFPDGLCSELFGL